MMCYFITIVYTHFIKFINDVLFYNYCVQFLRCDALLDYAQFFSQDSISKGSHKKKRIVFLLYCSITEVSVWSSSACA